MPKQIWTIGHSTHTSNELVAMLKSFDIQVLADIRRFPGSRKFPQFNKDNLEKMLPENGIEYLHFEDLGGRRKPLPDSRNTAWRLDAFKGYADYMETENFKKAIKELEKVAEKKRVAFMCSEAVWWSCHRSLVSDYLKSKSWDVQHIMGVGKSQEHPYTKPARIENGKLVYH